MVAAAPYEVEEGRGDHEDPEDHEDPAPSYGGLRGGQVPSCPGEGVHQEVPTAEQEYSAGFSFCPAVLGSAKNEVLEASN